MLKKLLVACFLLVLLSSVFSIRIADPISKTLSDNDSVGSFVAGSQAELVFSKELGRFDSLRVMNSLPQGFKTLIKAELESFKLFVDIPQKAVPGDYPLLIELSGPNSKETVNVYFLVDNSLVDASVNNYFADAIVNLPATYKVSFINNSYADVYFVLTPNNELSWNWLSPDGKIANNFPKHFLVPKRRALEGSFSVYPRLSGEKFFSVSIALPNGEIKKADLRVKAYPTMVSKSYEPAFGFPFYSFSLLPNYFLNAFFASFFN